MWKVEVCCGQVDAVYDAAERTEMPFDIVRFMTSMSFLDSMEFCVLYGVSKCGTRADEEAPQKDAAFPDFEAKVLGKILEAALELNL
jgi:hypothetical protein